MDISKTIIPKSDQLNADDLIAGPRTIRVTRVTAGGAEQPVSIHFEGDEGKPYKPCKSMRRVLVKVWGADSTVYMGRSMTLFREEAVKWAGQEVGGIRISHVTNIEEPIKMALTMTKSSRAPYIVKPLTVQAPTSGIDAAIQDGREKLENAATHGTDALKAAWASLRPAVQKALQPELEALKAKASTNE